MISLPAGTAMVGKGSEPRAALERHDLTLSIAQTRSGGAKRSMGVGPRGKSHPPEIAQGSEGLDPGFPKLAVLRSLHPNYTKPGRALRKTVNEIQFRANFKFPGHSHHGSQNTNYSGMRFFFQQATIGPCGKNLYRNTHAHAPVLPALFKLRWLVQATFHLRTT